MQIKDLDLELERLVFLNNACEGNPGIYELTWELGFYELTIEDKYKIAHKLLSSLLKDGLVTLEKFRGLDLKDFIERVSLENAEDILNNPANWYPCNEIYSISLTEKGQSYLDEQTNVEKLNKRLLSK